MSDSEIHEAVAADDADEVSAILAADPTQIHARQDYTGCTPLHLAAHCDATAVAEVLWRFNPDIDARDDDGFTPLHLACQNGSSKMAGWLIERGADINCRNSSGHTALFDAVSGREFGLAYGEITRLLLDAKITVDVASAICLGMPDVLRQRLDTEAPVNFNFLLELLIVHTPIVLSGVKFGQAPANGRFPLSRSDIDNACEILVLLLDRGALPTKYANLPSLVRLDDFGLALADILLKRGASVGERDAWGKTALQRAKEFGNSAAINLLQRYGATE